LSTVRSRLELVAEDTIRDLVVDGWALPVGELSYLPEGGGAYHWIAHGDACRRWFVTCDDLQTKPWLGTDPQTVFDRLLAAYLTALALRTGGLDFVVAPIPSRSGAPAVRVDDRHSVAVFEHVDGEAGRWGRPMAPGELREVIAMLARLHACPAGEPGLVRRGIEVAGRPDLEQALGDLDGPWDGGPLSEPARVELAAHLDLVVGWLADLDRFAARREAAGVDAVLTHGEPHPGNLIRTADGLVLIDWDTVAVAPRERDLWMFDDPALIALYGELTGVTPDPDALAAYRLLWALTDLAAFTCHLRAPHHPDPDATRALTALRSILARREPASYGPPPP
jgi:spectinomycin phosphotransferase